MAALGLAVLVPSVLSLAVTAQALLRVRLTVVPSPTSPGRAGTTALASLELPAPVSFVFTTFQLASTPLPVTVNGAPALGTAGVPVFPFAVPGAAVSPG